LVIKTEERKIQEITLRSPADADSSRILTPDESSVTGQGRKNSFHIFSKSLIFIPLLGIFTSIAGAEKRRRERQTEFQFQSQSKSKSKCK
jgi:hypothetical protein